MSNLQLELFPVIPAEWPATDDEGYLGAVAVTVLGRAQAEELLDHLASLCADCGTDTIVSREIYLVTPDLWAAAGVGRGFLCVGCFEARLGRHLTPDDFPPEVPINRSGRPRSARLRSRMDGPK